MNYHYKVLGVKRLDFVNDDGERINGCQLWCAAATSAPAWLGGVEVFKIWIDFSSPLFGIVEQLRSGDEITGESDRRGRPITIIKQ